MFFNFLIALFSLYTISSWCSQVGTEKHAFVFEKTSFDKLLNTLFCRVRHSCPMALEFWITLINLYFLLFKFLKERKRDRIFHLLVCSPNGSNCKVAGQARARSRNSLCGSHSSSRNPSTRSWSAASQEHQQKSGSQVVSSCIRSRHSCTRRSVPEQWLCLKAHSDYLLSY